MKKFFTLCVTILVGLQLFAQSRYAYLPEGKTTFQTSTEKIIVGFRPGHKAAGHSMEVLSSAVSDTGLSRTMGVNKWTILSMRQPQKNADSIGRLLLSLRADTNVAYANPFVVYKDGTLQGLTDLVIVRVKPASSEQALHSAYARLGVYLVEANPYLSREYFLTIHPTARLDAMDVADSLYETGLFDYSEPDFVKLGVFRSLPVPPPPPVPNDPLFGDQWNLQNTGQYSGTAGADIKAPAAWCTATGVGIKIAIIDEGVDLVQPDLVANLLPGYDALGQGTNGAPTGDDAHGTACAGIAAAVANNNLGVAGVASSAKIIPVRAGSGGSISNSTGATAIGWAANTAGADVISCSWGGGSSSSSLNSAIASAISTGRGGKGCTVLFASGDNNVSTISYPSNQPNVISVGGTNMCDQRFVVTPTTAPNSCNYDTRLATSAINGASSYGTGLGIVAPGINIPTTDISGTPGFSDVAGQGWEMSGTNYVLNFDGTSASCPMAAGVVALILSVNPTLTYSQATNILESTADEVGGYSYSTYLANGYWNNEMGYGRIDAAAAVQKALGTLSISGPAYICSGSATYSVPAPPGATTTWSVSNGSATLSCTACASTSLTAVSQGAVVLTATFTGTCGALTGGTVTKVIETKQNPLTETNTAGTCSGSTQTWTLAVSPGSQGSNYNWYVSYTGTNSSIYVLSPNASQTFVDVVGGGTVSLTYKDICGVTQSNGATVYSECGARGAVVLAPNPASNTVSVLTAKNSGVAEKTPGTEMAATDTLKINTEALNGQQTPGTQGLLSIATIRIYDASGKQRKQIDHPLAGSVITIDVSDLVPGIYFVQFSDGKLFYTKKLVIAR